MVFAYNIIYLLTTIYAIPTKHLKNTRKCKMGHTIPTAKILYYLQQFQFITVFPTFLKISNNFLGLIQAIAYLGALTNFGDAHGSTGKKLRVFHLLSFYVRLISALHVLFSTNYNQLCPFLTSITRSYVEDGPLPFMCKLEIICHVFLATQHDNICLYLYKHS
jgi:hypothetical protein